MGPEIAGLATGGAGVLVGAMITDAWSQTKARFLALWRRHCPGQEEALDTALEAAREDLTALEAGQPRDQAAAAMRLRWQARFEVFLENCPEAAEDLGEILAQLGGQEPPAGGHVTQNIHASRDAYTSAGAMTIHQSPGS